MKHYFLSLLITGAVLFSANSLFAQGDVLAPSGGGGFLIGPVGGINLVNYKTDVFPILSSEPTCFTAQNGSDIAPFFGLTAEIPLTDNMHDFIVVEALYDSKSSKFTATGNNRDNVPTKVNGVVANGSITTGLTSTLTYLLINAGYKYNFTEGTSPVGPGIQLCASVGLKLSNTLNKTVTVSAAVVGQKTVTNTSDNTQAQGIRFGVRGQFTYDIPLSLQWIATPTVGYDLPFTKVDKTTANWSASAIYGGVAIRYFLGK